MGNVPADATPEPSPPRLWAVRRWRLWEISQRVAIPILVLELLTVAAVVAISTASPIPTIDRWLTSVVIIAVGLAHAEIVLNVERVRRRLGDSNHVDLSSVWTFCGALVLPPALAAATAVVVHIHGWARTGEPPRVPSYRAVFSTTTVVLACIVTSAAQEHFGILARITARDAGDVLLIVGLIGLYTVVNSGLIAAAVAATAPNPTLARVLGNWEDNVLEIATLALGALAAIAISIHLSFMMLVVLPLLVLHRAVLVRQLEHAASTDSKTGLLNAAAWHTRSESLLRTARKDRCFAVLVLDLDFFKTVNDTYGHLVGDQVLAAVASSLRTVARDRDVIGRFGGEEFVILLNCPPSDVITIAERIRQTVSALEVEIPTPDGPLSIGGQSVSIGGALHPADGYDLTALLRNADRALYQVKRSGRNGVHIGATLEPDDTDEAKHRNSPESPSADQ